MVTAGADIYFYRVHLDFPGYTGGMYDGKLIVSRGLSNTSRFPRIGNPTELVYIDLIPIK
jgi:predicted MPP superfamily phosphohydrolase